MTFFKIQSIFFLPNITFLIALLCSVLAVACLRNSLAITSALRRSIQPIRINSRVILVAIFAICLFIPQLESVQASNGESNIQIKQLDVKGNRFFIELRDVEIADFLKVLARKYKLNIWVDNQINQRITVSFNDIGLEEAIKSIAESSNLIFVKQGKIIKLIKKSLTLRYVEAKELLKQTSRNKQEAMMAEAKILDLLSEKQLKTDRYAHSRRYFVPEEVKETVPQDRQEPKVLEGSKYEEDEPEGYLLENLDRKMKKEERLSCLIDKRIEKQKQLESIRQKAKLVRQQKELEVKRAREQGKKRLAEAKARKQEQEALAKKQAEEALNLRELKLQQQKEEAARKLVLADNNIKKADVASFSRKYEKEKKIEIKKKKAQEKIKKRKQIQLAREQSKLARRQKAAALKERKQAQRLAATEAKAKAKKSKQAEIITPQEQVKLAKSGSGQSTPPPKEVKIKKQKQKKLTTAKPKTTKDDALLEECEKKNRELERNRQKLLKQLAKEEKQASFFKQNQARDKYLLEILGRIEQLDDWVQKNLW